MERCDHEGDDGAAGGLESVSSCTECKRTWPARFGVGAPTIRIVSKPEPL
jgi:hypothetical protein